MAGTSEFYRESDADLRAVDGQQIAIIGYGNLGRPAACNLRDSGLRVVVGARPDSPSAERARADGHAVLGVETAIAESDVVWLAVPDETAPELLAPTAPVRARPGSLLVFSSGYCLAYELLKLPEDVDVALIAPRMIGSRLRERFERGEGFYSFVSVEQDATGTARARMLALALAFGTLRRGALALSASTEAALDLFVEQTVGPELGMAILSAFEVGSKLGLPPEALALELYLSGEMAATWQAFADHGFFRGVRLHGHAASFGGFVRMGDVDTEEMKARFARTLEDITSGRFAGRFQEELAAGSPTRALIDAMIDGDDPLTAAEDRIRDGRDT